MSIFDTMFNPQDPTKVGQIASAFALLGQQGFGNAGIAGLRAAQQFKAQQQADEMQKLQMEQARLGMDETRRKVGEAQSLSDAIRGAVVQPQMPASMDARDIGQPGEQQLTPTMDWSRLPTQLAQAGSTQALKFMPEVAKPDYKVVGNSLVQVGPQGVREAYRAPDKPQADPEQIRVLKAIYGDGTPGYQAALERLGQKTTTHSPAVSVSYGAPQAGVNEKGEQVFFQPSKDGKTPPAIVQGVRPAPQNRDTKLPAELQRMQIAGDAMGSLLNDYESLLKKNNPRDPMVQANPAVRAEMQSLKRNLELQFKELQALGALAGPDVEIMRQALSDPFSVQGALYGREGLMAQIKQARSLLQKRGDAVMRSQGKDIPAAADSDPLGLRTK